MIKPNRFIIHIEKFYILIIRIVLEFQSMKIIESTEKYIDENFMNIIQKKKGLCDILHYNETLMNTIM